MILKPLRLILPLVLSLLIGCVTTSADEIRISLSKNVKDVSEIERFSKVLEGIAERNKTVEDSPEWLKEAYSSIMIKRLNDVPKERYVDYKKFLIGNEVYIIIHPSYYAFFNNEVTLSSRSDKKVYPLKNIVERFYDRYYDYDYGMIVMQEQERLLRDFVEVMSTEKKLIILILPRNWKERLTYGYIDGLDEYLRYINEITNMSESALYMESAMGNNGYMLPEDLNILNAFLMELGVKKVMLGGGYVGRCLTQFYDSIRPSLASACRECKLYVVPEITAVAVIDLNNKWGDSLLRKDGRINFNAAARNLRDNKAYNVPLKADWEVRRLLIYNFYPKKKKEQVIDKTNTIPENVINADNQGK